MRPEFLLFLLFGGLYGALFHLWRGRTLRDLVTYEIVGIVSFAVGAVLGSLIGWRFLTIGQLYVLEATLFCWAALFVAKWLKS